MLLLVSCSSCSDMLLQLCSYTARLKTPLETSSCIVLAVRAYNKVGLYSTITHQLRGCDFTSKVMLTVVDAVATTQDGWVEGHVMSSSTYTVQGVMFCVYWCWWLVYYRDYPSIQIVHSISFDHTVNVSIMRVLGHNWQCIHDFYTVQDNQKRKQCS